MRKLERRAPGRASRWRSCVDSRRSEVLGSFEPGRREKLHASLLSLFEHNLLLIPIRAQMYNFLAS